MNAYCSVCYRTFTVGTLLARCPEPCKSKVLELSTKYQGPGTKLKNIFSWFGITEDEDCDCTSHVELMDRWGPKGCEQNIETVLGFLVQSANKQQIYYSEFAARRAIKLAIYLSKRSMRK